MQKSAELINYGRDFVNFIDEMCNQYGNFQKAIVKTYDIFTGFHIDTPEEHLFVLESRAKDPQKATFKLAEYTEKFPVSIRIVFDPLVSYEFPRLYYQLNSLVQHIVIPIPIVDLMRIDEMYYRRSRYSAFYQVAQKIYGLFTCKDATSNEMFPTVREINDLMLKVGELYTAPINMTYTIRPPTEPRLEENRSLRRTFTKKMKPVLASEMSFVCKDNEKIDTKRQITASIVKPDSKPGTVLKMSLSKRCVSVEDHLEISTWKPSIKTVRKNINDWKPGEVKKAPRRYK